MGGQTLWTEGFEDTTILVKMEEEKRTFRTLPFVTKSSFVRGTKETYMEGKSVPGFHFLLNKKDTPSKKIRYRKKKRPPRRVQVWGDV